MKSSQRLAFYLSLVCLSILYGYAANRLGWFPTDVLDRAYEQAGQLASPPPFLSLRVYHRQGARTVGGEGPAPGLRLVGSTWEGEDGWRPGLRLIDAAGEVHHAWSVDPKTVFEQTEKRPELGNRAVDIQGSHLFANGDVLVNLEYLGTVRLDACSRVRWRLSGGGHHSIARAEDGTFWIPGVSPRPRTATPDHPDGPPGLERPVYHEYLRRVSPDGEVLDSIHVLDLLYENGLQRHIVKTSHGRPADVTHLNDIEPLPAEMAPEYPLFEAGDLVVSLRNLDLVLVVDPDTRRVKWHAAEPVLLQHDPDFIGDGWIGVFDNNHDLTERGTMLGGSRIVALRPHTSAKRILFPTDRSEPFYTDVRGKWQQLENGNLLLVESETGRVVEVAPDGRTLWEWIVAPYDDELVPYVTDAARVEITREQVSAWPCSPGDSSG